MLPIDKGDDVAADTVDVIDATRARFAPARPQTNTLGFTVRAARTLEHLSQVCQLRARAFGRRQPELARQLVLPEDVDFDPGTLVLMVSRRDSGELVGTARMQTNLPAPLEYETHIALPAEFHGRVLGVGSRLAVVAGADSVAVTKLMIKAIYGYCNVLQIARVLVTAEPPRERLYKVFGFEEVFPGRLYRTESTPQYGCKLLYFDLSRTRETLLRTNPGYWTFLQTHTSDIELFTSSLSGVWSRPRRGEVVGITPQLARPDDPLLDIPPV